MPLFSKLDEDELFVLCVELSLPDLVSIHLLMTMSLQMMEAVPVEHLPQTTAPPCRHSVSPVWPQSVPPVFCSSQLGGGPWRWAKLSKRWLPLDLNNCTIEGFSDSMINIIDISISNITLFIVPRMNDML